jgi:hypothetical protein
VNRLVDSFESCTLPLAGLRHREHVQLAWLYLRDASSFEQAGVRFCTGLRRFAHAHGKAGLYHETITWAYLALVNERMHRAGASDFSSFALANPDLLDHKSGALAARYDQETLRSELARRVFLLPGGREGLAG